MDRPRIGLGQLATAFITLVLVTFLACFSIVGTGNMYDNRHIHALREMVRRPSESNLEKVSRQSRELQGGESTGFSLGTADEQELPRTNLADPENYNFVQFIKESKSLSRIPLNSVSPVAKRIFEKTDCNLPDLVYPTPILKKNAEDSVPRILHLTWKSELLPGLSVQWVKQWKRTNPDWQVWYWTDTQAKAFVSKYFPTYTVFRRYKAAIERADAIRYFVLYHYGGVYADLDIEPLVSLNPIVDKYTCFLSQEPDEHSQLLRPYFLNKFRYLACNAVMACRKNHPYFKYVIDNLARNLAHQKVTVGRTGPFMLSQMHVEYVEKFTKAQCDDPNQRIGIMPTELFIPTFDSLQIETMKRMCKNQVKLLPGQQRVCTDLRERQYTNQAYDVSFTVHHWFHTWTKLGHAEYFKKGFTFNSTHINNVLPDAKIIIV
ncbi:uncharacterized protein LOC135503608 [Lineus longissimus]|uniref:uncharacterized protein LOC135503608 n=1 Tax=Lineus longissimus TaxID=88925 RepID=UPI00315C95B1